MTGAAAASSASAKSCSWGLALVLSLGLLVQLPTLRVGFFADDYGHQLILRAHGSTPIPRWNLYDFGRAPQWAEFARGGYALLPWWTGSDWKIRFFRPLTSLTLRLDYALWNRESLGYHVTNLVLWMLLLVLVHRLYEALGLPPRVAILGLLVFALSHTSSFPVGWIAHRNSVLEALFAIGAVLAALRGGVGTALTLGLAAALSKESGGFALLLVAAIFHARGQSRSTCVALLAFGAHLTFLVSGGYGARSLYYVTPWIAPVRFLENLVLLASGGVLSLLSPAPLEVFLAIPRSVLLALSIIVGCPLAVAIWRRVPRGEARALLGAWTVLSLLPQGGAPPGDRLLFVPAIGAAGLLAMAWRAERARWGDLSLVRRTGAWVLALSVTVGSGLYLLTLNGTVLPGMAYHVREKVRATDVGPRIGSRRDVLVLQTESQLQGLTLSWTWHAEVDDESVHFALMQSGRRGLRWTRTDDRTFELEALRSCFLDTPLEGVFLTSTGLKVGTRWRTPDFEVEALTVDKGCFRRFRVTLDRSLDDPSLRFVRPVEGVLSRLEPPAVGTTLELPAAAATSLAP
jgi:hypothetical protein